MQLPRGYAVTGKIVANYISLWEHSVDKSLNPTLNISRRSSVGKALPRSLIQRLLVWAQLCATIFSCNNVCLLAYVFTGEDPQPEWLKLDESNKVYWFEIRFLSLVLQIKHCVLSMQFCYFVKTIFPDYLFLRYKQVLHADNHIYVVLVAGTFTEAARILSYFSCDVIDFWFLCKYSVKLQ